MRTIGVSNFNAQMVNDMLVYARVIFLKYILFYFILFSLDKINLTTTPPKIFKNKNIQKQKSKTKIKKKTLKKNIRLRDILIYNKTILLILRKNVVWLLLLMLL